MRKAMQHLLLYTTRDYIYIYSDGQGRSLFNSIDQGHFSQVACKLIIQETILKRKMCVYIVSFVCISKRSSLGIC